MIRTGSGSELRALANGGRRARSLSRRAARSWATRARNRSGLVTGTWCYSTAVATMQPGVSIGPGPGEGSGQLDVRMPGARSKAVSAHQREGRPFQRAHQALGRHGMIVVVDTGQGG